MSTRPSPCRVKCGSLAMLLAMPRPWAWCLRPHDLTAWILSPGRTFPSRSGSLAMLLAMRLASFLLNDTDRS
jgi:hypothetical protein